VAGAFKGSPHVPGGDGAVGAPAFPEGQKFFGAGHVFFAVSDGPAFLHAEVMDGEYVGAAEAEDQEHFDGPGANAADGDKAFDEFFVGEFEGLVVVGDDAFDRFSGKIFHGQDFCAGKTSFAQLAFAEFEDFLWCGGFAGSAQRFDAGENCFSGFAGDRLVGDGFQQGFVGGLGVVDPGIKWDNLLDQASDAGVGVRQMSNGDGEVERERWRCGHDVE